MFMMLFELFSCYDYYSFCNNNGRQTSYYLKLKLEIFVCTKRRDMSQFGKLDHFKIYQFLGQVESNFSVVVSALDAGRTTTTANTSDPATR